MIKTIILDEAKVKDYLRNINKSKDYLKAQPEIGEKVQFAMETTCNDIERFLEATKIKQQKLK